MLHLFCLRFLFTWKSLEGSKLHNYSQTHTRTNVFGLLDPSRQISLIWAKKTKSSKIRRHITHACTRRSKEFKAETSKEKKNEKHKNHISWKDNKKMSSGQIIRTILKNTPTQQGITVQPAARFKSLV